MPWSAINQSAFEWVAIGGGRGLVGETAKALAEWPIFMLPAMVAGLWLLGQRSDREAAVGAAVAALVAMFAAHFASVIVDHPRPFMLGLAPNVLDHAPDSSSPSDHATLFFVLAASFGLRPSTRLRRLGLALAPTGLAVGMSRVALGVHFPSDVLGAAAIGAGCAAIVGSRLWNNPLAMLIGVAEAVRESLLDRVRRRGSSLSRDDARPAG